MKLHHLSLLGLAIGDAFGETLFGEPASSAARVASRTLVPRRPWRWTDDTAMALSIVELLDARGAIDPDVLAQAFARRYVADPMRGYGQGAATLLTRVAHGADWRVESRELFDGQGSYGNGGAMRAPPIGAFFAGDLDRVVAEAARSAAPTHAHPEGAAGAIAIAVAASLVATGVARDRLIAEVCARTPAGPVREGLERARDLELAADPLVVGPALGTGREVAARDTVPWCVWVCARHLASYEDACWVAGGQLGDRDTNAAIVGGIVVLATGEAGIPPVWRAAVEPIPM